MKVIRECGRARNAQGWRKLGPRGLCGNSNLGQPPYNGSHWLKTYETLWNHMKPYETICGRRNIPTCTWTFPPATTWKAPEQASQALREALRLNATHPAVAHNVQALSGGAQDNTQCTLHVWFSHILIYLLCFSCFITRIYITHMFWSSMFFVSEFNFWFQRGR